MSAGHNDARLLFSIGHINAYHIQQGEESSLTPSGGQTLSLLMVPTSSPFADLSNADPQSAAPEEDFYLHLHLPPELDLPLPATTQIYHQPPRSYLIPRWDLGPDVGAFTRIEFPSIGSGPGKVAQDEIDTFETILAQCTAFLEKTKFSADTKGHPPPAYNPADYAPGEGYIGTGSERDGHGHIVLIDEENGSVVGELSQGYQVVEGTDVKAGSKKPVEIQLPQEGKGNQISVNEVSEEYLKMANHPAYKNSTIVQNAAMASRLIVTGSDWLGHTLNKSATTFTEKTKPSAKPLTFSPTTQERVRKLNNLTHGAVGLSAATVGQVGRIAQNLGAKLAGRSEAKQAKHSKDGGKHAATPPDYKPGVMNKSMIAFSTIADGIEQSAKQLLGSGSAAASTMVGHRYGPEAGKMAGNIVGGFKNVGLVYVDATGVSRKAVLKSVAKGMVVGRMADGGELVVGDGDGGKVPDEMLAGGSGGSGSGSGVSNQGLPGTGQPGLGGAEKPGEGVVGFGNQASTASRSGIGEPLGSSTLQGQEAYPYEKR